MAAKGEGRGGGMEWEVGVSRYRLLYGMDKQQGPTVWNRELCSISYDKP